MEFPDEHGQGIPVSSVQQRDRLRGMAAEMRGVIMFLIRQFHVEKLTSAFFVKSCPAVDLTHRKPLVSVVLSQILSDASYQFSEGDIRAESETCGADTDKRSDRLSESFGTPVQDGCVPPFTQNGALPSAGMRRNIRSLY